MDIIKKLLRTLFPKSFLYQFRGNLGHLTDGISDALTTQKTYTDGVLDESLPSSANSTLPEWYELLGLSYDPTVSLANRQAEARQAYTALGGQHLDYLNSTIQIAFPLVFITKIQILSDNMVGEAECGEAECEGYPSWYPLPAQDGTEPVFYYLVSGQINDDEQLARLVGLLDRIAPGELQYVLDLVILSETDTSQAGVAVCGLAECNAE
jgi:uncharacterized protein YmfQ (DUF2313 family)